MASNGPRPEAVCYVPNNNGHDNSDLHNNFGNLSYDAIGSGSVDRSGSTIYAPMAPMTQTVHRTVLPSPPTIDQASSLRISTPSMHQMNTQVQIQKAL